MQTGETTWDTTSTVHKKDTTRMAGIGMVAAVMVATGIQTMGDIPATAITPRALRPRPARAHRDPDRPDLRTRRGSPLSRIAPSGEAQARAHANAERARTEDCSPYRTSSGESFSRSTTSSTVAG